MILIVFLLSCDGSKEIAESPCSSDDKNDWKSNRDGRSGSGVGGNVDSNKRWARGQTSSSSRDVSPWDDDVPEYYKRRIPPPPPANNRGYYMRHGRRMTSGDDDYDYEDDRAITSGSMGRDGKRRDKRLGGSIGRGDGKTGINRSRETFDIDAQNWYHSPSNHHNWSPADDDDNDPDDNRSGRMFDRNAYERSTYGPPYEKRSEPTTLPIYDRKDYKSYDKRKYYQNYVRPSYEFEGYGDISGGGGGGGYKDKKISYYDDYEQRVKGRKEYDDDLFESPASSFSRDARSHKTAKEYFYDRGSCGGGGGSSEKRSFDRESMDSYDSGRRKKSFGGSGDMYGSLGSQEEFRERYVPVDKIRSLRGSGKGVMKQQRSHEEYDQDSEGDVMLHRGSGPGDSRSLQRPSGSAGPTRPRKSSGSSPWDGEGILPHYFDKFSCCCTLIFIL